jgi:hypothetical protein
MKPDEKPKRQFEANTLAAHLDSRTCVGGHLQPKDANSKSPETGSFE